jgi:hypothetical protein
MFTCLWPCLPYVRVGEVAAEARRYIICVIVLATVSNTATRDLCDDNGLVKPAGTGRVLPGFILRGQCEAENLSNIWYGALGGGWSLGLFHTAYMPR